MKIAIIQMPGSADRERNLRYAEEKVLEAAAAGAELAVLPEMFLCPYTNQAFIDYAEPKGGDSYRRLSSMAKAAHITLAAGSFPEKDGEKIYNTCFVFDPEGIQIARHRKVHLFDIDIKGGQKFQESATFSGGEDVTVFPCGGHTFAICICFDIRFNELFTAMALKGAEAILIPAAFNMTTGPKHWEMLFRCRAVDYQVYTVGIAPARDLSAPYISYANSLVCDPWGEVVERLGTEPNMKVVDLDFDLVRSVREQLPVLSARKPEVYY